MVDLLLGGLVAAEPSQQIACVLVATSRCIVTGAIREHLDEGHQYESRDALEGEQKAPSDVGVAVVDEGEAKGQPIRDRDSEVYRVSQYSSRHILIVNIQLAMKT